VQERGLDRRRVEAELGEDLGRCDRVDDVRFTGSALLALVRRDGEVVGAVDGLEVRPRVFLQNRGMEEGPERLEIGALAVAIRGDDGRAPWTPVGGGVLLRLRAWCRACHLSQGYAQSKPARPSAPQ